MKTIAELPKHKCGLYLSHNEHRDLYQSVQDYLCDNPKYDWPSNEAKERVMATDEMWQLQWYPDTPIGFHRVAAPTLEELLEFASTYENTRRTN